MSTRLRMVALISGGGSNLQSIINHCASGTIDASLVAVISDRDDAYGLRRAIGAGLPAHTVNRRHFNSRQAFDAALRARLDDYRPGLLVLAGFMRILTADFIGHYAGRVLNIHPSLLPDLPGLHTHQRALDAGYSRHGASVHFVTSTLDGGPLVLQAAVTVKRGTSAAALAARVLRQEHRIYPKAIGWYAAGRLRCDADIAYLDGQPIHDPFGLKQRAD